MKEERLEEILKQFKRQRILVVGDLILDRFVLGKVSRISPEAPVPIVKMERESFSPGGAGNVGANITSLGGRCKLIGVIGDDPEGRVLREILKNRQISALGGLLIDSSRPTITKTRILAQGQQLLRLDKEEENSLSWQYEKRIEHYLRENIKNASAILISDYGKGTITPSLLSILGGLAKSHKKIITVDPEVEHFSLYREVSLLTPNRQEAALGINPCLPLLEASRGAKTQKEVNRLGRKIKEKLKPQYLFITQGKDGMTIFEKERITHIPAKTREVFDVTGAGDTVIGVATLALSAGATILEAATIASFAAGVVVGKVGTATVSVKEIKEFATTDGRR